MKTQKVIFWVFWLAIFSYYTFLFWTTTTGTMETKQDMAKFSFGLTLLYFVIESMADGNDMKIWRFLLLLAMAVVLPCWFIWLPLTWVVLYFSKELFTWLTNLEEKFS